MAIDWQALNLATLPTLTFPAYAREAALHAAQADFTGDSNLQAGMMQFNRTTGRWEEWSGSAWVPKTPSVQRRVLTSDYLVTSSSMTTIPELSGIVTDADARYSIRGVLRATASAPATLQVRLEPTNENVSGGRTANVRYLSGISGDVLNSYYSEYFTNDGEFSSFNAGGIERFYFEFEVIIPTISSAGTVNFRVDPDAASVVTVRHGTYIEVVKLENPPA